VTVRELTIASVYHPEYLFDGALMRVDHPTVRPLVEGEPTLGWEGDPRLVIYLHLRVERFVLYRLEADGEYRGVAQLPAGAEITPESMNKLIARLVAVDTRRGYDAMTDLDKAEASVLRAKATDYQAELEQVADALHFGLARSHLPGIHHTRIRNAPSKR
jgi:hypothetical protein